MSISNLENKNSLDIGIKGEIITYSDGVNDMYFGYNSEGTDSFGYWINSNVGNNGDFGCYIAGKNTEKTQSAPIIDIYSANGVFPNTVLCDNLTVSDTTTLNNSASFSFANPYLYNANININGSLWIPGGIINIQSGSNEDIYLNISDVAIKSGGYMYVFLNAGQNSTFQISGYKESDGTPFICFPSTQGTFSANAFAATKLMPVTKYIVKLSTYGANRCIATVLYDNNDPRSQV